MRSMLCSVVEIYYCVKNTHLTSTRGLHVAVMGFSKFYVNKSTAFFTIRWM